MLVNELTIDPTSDSLLTKIDLTPLHLSQFEDLMKEMYYPSSKRYFSNLVDLLYSDRKKGDFLYDLFKEARKKGNWRVEVMQSLREVLMDLYEVEILAKELSLPDYCAGMIPLGKIAMCILEFACETTASPTRVSIVFTWKSKCRHTQTFRT